MTLLRLGVTRGFGAELRGILAVSTSNRIKAFFSGMLMTVFLQSSTAAVLIVASFAGQGMITAGAGIAVVLGADVGTTLVAQFLSLDMGLLVPVCMAGGYVLFSIEHGGRIKNVGRMLVGLALMLLALGWIRETAEPLKEAEILPMILQSLDKDPFFAILVTVLLTWLAHSSLAIVLLLMSFAASGVLPPMLALYMVLGANLGGTIPPLIATLRDDPDAMRIPLGNMLVRIIGVLAVVPFIHILQPHVGAFSADAGRQIVNFHTGFNIALALVFLPVTGWINTLLEKALPERVKPKDPGRPLYLDDKNLDTPSVALAAATRETLRMGDMVEEMLKDTIQVLQTNDKTLMNKVKKEDDAVDSLYTAIKNYMARLTEEFMGPKEAERYVQILMFATNLEHTGDVIDKNLMVLAKKKIERQLHFSEEGMKEIGKIHDFVMESVQLAQSVFVSGDVDMARRLLKDKELIRKAEIDGMATHIDRLRDGVPETLATSSLHLDIIRDYRRINTYMCTVAYPILEGKGQIRSSRLRPEKERGEGGE